MNDPFEISRAYRLRIMELEKELEEEKDSHARTLDLLMKGEALRENLLFQLILNRGVMV